LDVVLDDQTNDANKNTNTIVGQLRRQTTFLGSTASTISHCGLNAVITDVKITDSIDTTDTTDTDITVTEMSDAIEQADISWLI